MESKKTTELRGKKTSVRTKLAAAVAMLLVSTIMLTTTTYAWFVLSTAPEVKGMSTTVGSNGSLEIALLNKETGADVNTISSGVGDSSVVAGVTEANVTWGNLVALNDAAYGLSKVTLYPAALNVATKVTDQPDQLKNLFNILKYPTYGVDGRVASLSANTEAGTLKNDTFSTSNADYGVRAIGSVQAADPEAYAFEAARTSFANSVRSAQRSAQSALSNNVQDLLDLAIAQAMGGKELDTVVSKDRENALRNALSGLSSAANSMEDALKYAVVARSLREGATEAKVAYEDVTLSTTDPDFATQITALNTFKTNLKTAIDALPAVNADKEYTYSDIKTSYEALLSINDVTIDGTTIKELKDKGIEGATDWVGKLTNPQVVARGGLYGAAADFVGEMTCSIKILTANGNMKVLPQDGVQHLATVATTVGNYTSPGGGQSQSIITTTYGYIVDLAVRCSSNGNLMLSNAVNRVTGDDETAGAGSTFTKTAGDFANLSGLRIVFVDAENNNILGVASPVETTTSATNSIYELHMFNYTVDADGCVALGTRATDDTITTLTADTIKKISVLVYLDGGSSKYAAESASGTVNLQFCTDANLVPMEYTGYVTTNPATAGLVITGDKTVVAGQKITNLAATYNGQAAAGVKWSVNSDNNCATIDADTGVLSATTAGTANVTATYTPAGAAEAVTATYSVTVTAGN